MDGNHVVSPKPLYAKTKKDAEGALLSAEGATDVVSMEPATMCGSSSSMRCDLVLNLMTAMAVKEG